jgi:hypothetical protein
MPSPVPTPPSLLPFPPRAGAPADAPPSRSGADLLARGLIAGSIASAALLGTLVGYGRREGRVWHPLNAAAHTLVGAHADGNWGYQSDVTPMGCVVVIVVSLLAGLLVARLVSTRRFPHLLAATAGVSIVGYLIHLHIVARAPGGLAALLSVGQLRALYLVLGTALLAGMRFAFLGLERGRTS